MLPAKEWLSRFNIFLTLVFVFLILSCGNESITETEDRESELVILPNETASEVILDPSYKTGLSEKMLIDGIWRYISMEYQAGIFSFLKSLEYNPKNLESKFFLAKSYVNSGLYRNSLELLEELKDNPYYFSFVVPKLKSIYANLSTISSEDEQISYVMLTNLYGISSNIVLFSLPSAIRIYEKDKILLSSFLEGTFLIIDQNFNYRKYRFGSKIDDIFYDEHLKVFYILSGDTLYLYSPGFFNLNLFNLNITKSIKLKGKLIKKIFADSSYIFLLDTLSSELLVIDKNSLEIVFELTLPSEISYFHVVDKKVILLSKDKIILVDLFTQENSVLFQGKELKSFFVSKNDIFVISGDDILILDKENFKEIYTLKNANVDELVVDSEGNIYGVNRKENVLRIFTRDYQMYSNLDVDIKSVFLTKYPILALFVGVRSQHGEMILNLKKENFELFESGEKVLDLDVNYTYSFLKKNDLYIVIEDSIEILENLELISDFLRNFLNEFSGTDTVSVYIAGKDGTKYLPRTNLSVLLPVDFIKRNLSGSSESNIKLDVTLYKAISDSLYSARNRTILLITSGNRDKFSEDTYSLRTIINYAYQNFIPIYVISLGLEDTSLEKLSTETGGIYFSRDFAILPKEVAEIMKKPKIYRYLLVFRSFFGDIYPESKLVDISVVVKYKNTIGKDMIKYIYPKPKGPRS